METLATFIWRRLQEVSVLEAEAQARLDEIKVERDQLRKAALAAGIATDAPPEQALEDVAKAQGARRASATVRKLPSITLKQGVLITLRDKGAPMLALDILDAINSRFKTDFPRTSLSPQLSRLKEEGLLFLDGREWSLTENGAVAAGGMGSGNSLFD